jgi:hypothetical protein
MDIDQAPIDTFITDLEADDAPRHVSDQGRGPLAKKLMFSSQEMPEEQATVFTAPPQSMILPKTLFVLTKEEMQQKGTPFCNKKKERKRKKKGEAAFIFVRPAARVLDAWLMTSPLGTPRGRCDEYSSKIFPQLRNQGMSIRKGANKQLKVMLASLR